MAKRSKFNLGHYKLFSCDMGELVPCGLTEVLPGDTIQMATSALVRCSPLVAPVMHPVHVNIHHWFVPHRLVWDDWEKFITGGPTGTDASVLPTISFASGAAVGSLADYLGVPTGVNGVTVSALPFRGYAKIWNEHYRDEDLETELTISKASGADTTTSVALQNGDWEKDYFTSSRPWEQKGSSITLPLGTSAPVVAGTTQLQLKGTTFGPRTLQVNASDSSVKYSGALSAVNEVLAWDGVNTGLKADLASASAVTVNTLRRALALQRFEEARARYGSRYVEYLRYLGIRGGDQRLQRPEYLGGGKQTIQFSEVLATADGGASLPIGSLKGHGIAAMRSNRFRRYFEEHGYVYTFMAVRPKTMYSQGLARTWNRRTREDFWQVELQHIGQQPVLNKEVYAGAASPDGVFGYQDRYDEYRRQESSIAGEFRSTLLDFWHMARVFASEPALNASFVKCVPTERNFAVPSQDNLYIMANHRIAARRLVAPVGSSNIF